MKKGIMISVVIIVILMPCTAMATYAGSEMYLTADQWGSIETIVTKVTGIGSNTAQIRSCLEDVKSDVGNVKSYTSNMNTNIAHIRESLSNDSYDGVYKRLGEIKELTGMSTTSGSALLDISTLNSNIQSLNTNVQGMDSTMTSVLNKMVTLQSQMTALIYAVFVVIGGMCAMITFLFWKKVA